MDDTGNAYSEELCSRRSIQGTDRQITDANYQTTKLSKISSPTPPREGAIEGRCVSSRPPQNSAAGGHSRARREDRAVSRGRQPFFTRKLTKPPRAPPATAETSGKPAKNGTFYRQTGQLRDPRRSKRTAAASLCADTYQKFSDARRFTKRGSQEGAGDHRAVAEA
ncbi:hypothetical protein TBK1r_23320 [Stieleria magnilauensis]|uniref:Uncharacterized protein n=1 Tax=Stieleria magnilauensis TaxID=2527963 RepID=A0ABX5XN33_9BACT|nr:hypothetical protein TBK1r_23320 [Planctomycetes bacterium TBK1r]